MVRAYLNYDIMMKCLTFVLDVTWIQSSYFYGLSDDDGGEMVS